MQPTPIIRPTWLALHRKTLLGLLTMGAIGAVGFRYLDRRPPGPAATIVTPIPTVVTVPIPTPTVNVTVQPPEPPAAPPPYIAPPRLLTPFLAAECLLPLAPDVEAPSETGCPSGMGLPAISPDGTTLAILTYVDDGGRGFTNIEMRYLDVATSKVLRTRPLITPDELDELGQATPTLVAKVHKKVAALQKQLVGYRTLVPLEQHPSDTRPDHGLYIEGDLSFEARHSGLLRVVDADAHAVLVQERFLVTNEYPARTYESDADPGCYPTHVSGTGAYWDARTRVILAEVGYSASPCYCGGETHHYVRIAPTP